MLERIMDMAAVTLEMDPPRFAEPPPVFARLPVRGAEPGPEAGADI